MTEYVDIEKVKQDHQRYLGYLDQDMINRLNHTLDKNVPKVNVIDLIKIRKEKH